MAKTPKSFIREILKVTERPEVISFAGGLPSPALIDVEGIRAACASVLEKDGKVALQYSTTEGYLPLRQFIADRYKKRLGLSISPDEILITNGSQQCLDLIGKVIIGTGDHVAIERPGYLGAIQAFSLYEPVFHPVTLGEEGPEIAELETTFITSPVKMFYGVPNSQNPSGITYSRRNRQEVARVMEEYGALFVEDDAYGELNFSGTSLPSVRTFLPGQTVITGSFSKILAPGMRMGWVVAPPAIMEQLVIAKQASDLHAKVTEVAELAQKHHDLMVESYRKADKSREAADAAHKSFVEAQESADAEHKFFIACQKELRDYDKVISGLRKKTKKVKVTKEQKAVRKEAESLFKNFRAGEKLTTDDILLLQRSKLI